MTQPLRILLGVITAPLRLAVAVLAGASAAAALVLWLAPASHRLDVMTHFAALYLAAGLLASLGAWALQMRGLVMIMAVFAAISAAVPVAPELLAGTVQALSPRPGPEIPRLKLLTMNLWVQNHNVDAAVALIRREQPDIIVIEEAADGWSELPIRIADDYAHMAFCARIYYCHTIILSRLDFVEDITPEDDFSIAAARMRLPDRLGGAVIDVAGVHAPWPWPAGRQQFEFEQLARLSHRLNPELALIAGDFNSTPWSNTLRELDREVPFPRRTRGFFSWPTPAAHFTRYNLHPPLPFMPIDQIYAGTNWRLVELRRGPNIGSDHYPVIAVFTPKVMPTPALRGFSPASAAARP